jgi:hypothetical protein
MRFPSLLLSLAFLVVPIASQQIWDIVSAEDRSRPIILLNSFLQWQTTWDRSKLFTSLAPSTPINFVSPSVIGAADIVVDETQTFQSVLGIGGTLSEFDASRPCQFSHKYLSGLCCTHFIQYEGSQYLSPVKRR